MYSQTDKHRLLNIYKDQIKKNLKVKYKVPNKIAEIGLNKYGFEEDFLEHTDDYDFVEPERVAIDVYEDILVNKLIIKVNDHYVLASVKKDLNHFGVKGISKRALLGDSPFKPKVGRVMGHSRPVKNVREKQEYQI